MVRGVCSKEALICLYGAPLFLINTQNTQNTQSHEKHIKTVALFIR